MDFWKSLAGMLTVEWISADPEKSLEAVLLEKIPLSHVVQKGELTYQVRIRRRDYRTLSGILRRRGDSLKIIRNWGLYWKLKAIMGHPVLLVLIVFLLLSSCYLPSRIFFVSVEGNTTIPSRLILSAAENCGICFGASRKLVRSEKVKNALLAAVPQLQWAGINTSGCTAVISVRERVKEKQKEEDYIVSNVIASQDGYILSATVTRGTPQVHPGDAVTRGQLLISGYTDCGICIQAVRAEGEIMAQTSREITAVMPEKWFHTARGLDTKTRISLLIGKKRINLWNDSRISDTGCGRMYEEYYVSLPGGFQLPLAICVDQYIPYKLREATVSQEEAQSKLQQFSDRYLKSQMVAGQILQKQDQLSSMEGKYRLECRYICQEMIGQEQREQIGVMNGKRS